MKILKGIGVFFLSLISFILILLFSLSFITKNVIQKGVVGSVVKNVIIEEFSKDEKLSDKDKENIDKVNKVIETDDINELASKILDEYENSLDNEDYKVSNETVNYIIDLLVKYKDLINDISNENVTEKQIRSYETREGITTALNEMLEDRLENTELSLDIIINSYNTFISRTFRICTIFFTVICFALIALIKKSYTKWMKPGSLVLIFAGILVSAIYFGIMFAFNQINNSADYKFIINATPIIVIGILEIVIGIILRIISIAASKKEKE